MAIQYNENIKIAAPLPLDNRYLSLRTSGGNPLAYSSTTEVNTTIISSERYVGLTVLINTGSTDTEYWYKNGITNGNLIEKKYDTEVPFSDYITGATNLGFFSGKTGVETLNISTSLSNYGGNYQSLYNWYYRGTDAKIHTGAPNDGILRRGYLKNVIPNVKSWVWNDYIGGGSLMGWILVDGNVASQIGLTPTVATYYNGTTTFPYTGSTWNSPPYNNGSQVTIFTVTGSLNTGTTLSIGGPPYVFKDHNNLHFRTLISDTPENIKVTFDESFVHVSGITSVLQGQNVGTGTGQVFKQRTGTTMQFRTIEGTGDTTVYQVGDRILISATGGVSGTTTATNIGTGVGVFKSKTGNTLQLRSFIGTGSTTVNLSGDTVVIGSTGGGTYDLASPSVIPLGGICSGTVLTGKTSFQLWEELLVPELFGTITAPSTSILLSESGLREIGCNLSQTVSGSFSRGSINPQYMSASAFRSGCANAYEFTGSGMPSGFQACVLTPGTANNPSYTVVSGTQSWSVRTRYDSGSTAMGSKGTPYGTPPTLPTGITSAASDSIVGVYPLFGTTVNITTLTKQTLQNMSTANNIQIDLVADVSPNKQKFEIPNAWLTSRPLVGVCQWNTVSSQWEYPGGSAVASLAIWTCSASSETIQGSSIGYCQYTYNSTDRSAVCIRLVF